MNPTWSLHLLAAPLLLAVLILLVMALVQRRYGEALVELPVAAVLGVVLFAPTAATTVFTHLPALGRV